MMNVTLNQLRAFERIVRLGGFSAAAKALGLTQPSISQRIRELESALDTPLFIRNGPRVSPTAEAHALLTYADRVLETETELRERFRSRDPLRGLLRIGVSENFALICMADMFRRLEERYPAIKASVFVGDSGALSHQLNRRELDLAIVSEPHVEAHVEQVPVGLSRLAWFARGDMALPRDTMTPRQLAGYHLMLAPPSARLHATVMQWFADAGAVPVRVSLCNNAAVTRQAIVGGAAIGVMSVRLMKDDLERHAVRVVPTRPPLTPHRVAICFQHSDSGPALQSFVDLMRGLIAQHDLFDTTGFELPAPRKTARRRTAAAAR